MTKSSFIITNKKKKISKKSKLHKISDSEFELSISTGKNTSKSSDNNKLSDKTESSLQSDKSFDQTVQYNKTNVSVPNKVKASSLKYEPAKVDAKVLSKKQIKLNDIFEKTYNDSDTLSSDKSINYS